MIRMKLLLCALLLVLGLPSIAIAFVDDEACLMCHKYPKMGRVTDEGFQKTYYVMPEVFSKTVHRNVPCRDCHYYIKQLPHRPVTEGVRCDRECHSIENPSTGKTFSHKSIYDTFKKSVHGREKLETGLDNDKPYCITCHTNPLYNEEEDAAPKKITDRCVVCHEDEKFAVKWYNHTSRRIREVKRDSLEIIELCSRCHADQEMIRRHKDDADKTGRELGEKYTIAAESYKKSFHGKVTKYGNTQAANCLSCHASPDNYYMSVHELRPSRDPLSPVNKNNRVQTCRQCHKTADANYAAIDPHPTHDKELNKFNYYAEIIYAIVGDVALIALVGLSLFETIGRRRDGIAWVLRNGTTWRCRSRRKK
ncbi:hypothetical protein MNBD_GAMMA26-1793 [hydrothermal vent metagenome]|uniref:Outer membrane cytochrome MtrC/MtrF-like domain-containing protein n=1 Tax=hydrothermal vent metagenome TaxID=652676 RepID=A0A3B1BK31_9ZZZZ